VNRKAYDPSSGKVFVFGSNRVGIHGKGAALYARETLGAVMRQGEGPMPDAANPKCYALPTKLGPRLSLSLQEVKRHVDKFLAYAASRPDLSFFVTAVGCGLAGYNDADIAPMFRGAPANCELPAGW